MTDTVYEDCFVVYVRDGGGHAGHPEDVERPVASCPSYEEACCLRRELQLSAHDCVIRYVGPAAGGD